MAAMGGACAAYEQARCSALNSRAWRRQIMISPIMNSGKGITAAAVRCMIDSSSVIFRDNFSQMLSSSYTQNILPRLCPGTRSFPSPSGCQQRARFACAPSHSHPHQDNRRQHPGVAAYSPGDGHGTLVQGSPVPCSCIQLSLWHIITAAGLVHR